MAAACTAFHIPRILLPAPTAIVAAFGGNLPLLGRDFVQTVLKAGGARLALGSALGFVVGVAIDRRRSCSAALLPLASLTGTVPLVRSGADHGDVVRLRVAVEGGGGRADDLLPDAASTLAGLQAAGKLERELMHSYAASYTRTLLDLRLPVRCRSSSAR